MEAWHSFIQGLERPDCSPNMFSAAPPPLLLASAITLTNQTEGKAPTCLDTLGKTREEALQASRSSDLPGLCATPTARVETEIREKGNVSVDEDHPFLR